MLFGILHYSKLKIIDFHIKLNPRNILYHNHLKIDKVII